eukprot:s5638_g5.t1
MRPIQCLTEEALVFEEKEKWKKYDQVPFPCDKDNYSSAKDNALAIQKQFRQEELKGAMMEIEEEEACRVYGSRLRIAALAALEKSDQSFRVVHDATHNVGVNDKIKVMDQLRYPGCSEIRRAMEVLHPVSFVLAADISRAHRLVLVREEDWGWQACRTGVDDQGGTSTRIWVNCVGTFGVTSASYHFRSMFGAVVRCAHALCSRRDNFQLTYVDDLLFLARGLGGIAGIWLTLLFLVIVGTPFSWHKCGGGLRAESIGFQVDISKKELGMTEKRLRWAREWIEKTITHKMVRVDEFRSALGRLAFMMSAFGHLKPLLGPLYSWVTAVDHCTALQVPAAVLMILTFLKRTLVAAIARTKVRPPSEEGGSPSDAKAEGEPVGDSVIGAPGSFSFVGGLSFGEGEGYEVPDLSRDKLGNRHLVSRLLTTKFPFVRGADAISLVAPRQRSGIAARLAAEAAEPRNRCAYKWGFLGIRSRASSGGQSGGSLGGGVQTIDGAWRRTLWRSQRVEKEEERGLDKIFAGFKESQSDLIGPW